MSQTFYWRHSNSEVTLATCWNIHASASAHFHQVLWTWRRGIAAQTYARPLCPTSSLTWKCRSLAIQWSQREVMGMRCLPSSSVTCMKLWIMDPDWQFFSGYRGGDIPESSEITSLNVAWWGVVVEDLTTCPSAHRLSGWQPGMNAWLHCPCPCSLREVWNKQLWSDSSFQKCLWERRWKKPSEKQRCQAKCPSFPWPELSKPRYSL